MSCLIAASCREVYLQQDSPTSGNYTIETLAGDTVRVFCDFYDSRGYTFIHREDLHLLTEEDLATLHTVNDHVMARILKTDGTQHDVSLEQLAEFRRYALGFRLSNYVDYTQPVNANLGPYLLLGFLPVEFANSETRQGYSAGGEDATFNNCGPNPNSYLALLQNPNGNINDESDYCPNCAGAVMTHWITRAQPIPTDRQMAEAFFYQFEMHLGGCGGYISSKSSQATIDGVSLGLGFGTSDSSLYFSMHFNNR